MEEIPMDALEKDVLLTGITREERELLYHYFATSWEGQRSDTGFCLFKKVAAQIWKWAGKLIKSPLVYF